MADDITIEINGPDSGVAQDIKDAIEDGIKKAADERGPQGIATRAELVARIRIADKGRIWTGELLEGFTIKHRRSGDTVVTILENEADHAPPIEYGAEYDEKGPPVVALLPWVAVNMRGFEVPEEWVPGYRTPDLEDETIEVDGQTAPVTSLFDDETIERAFWLQEKLYEDGIDGIGFMQRARRWTEQNADQVTRDFIEQELLKA